MAGFFKGLFNKKKKDVVVAESDKSVASAKAAESETPVASAKPAKVEKPPKAEKPAKPPKAEKPAPAPARVVAQKEDANSFFLDADSAKTFGDIDYMRTSKAVRKTFPKVLGAKEGAELFESTSSVDKVDSMAQAAKAETPEIKPSQESSDRRRRDTSMDMFRNMAKDIKR